MADKLKDARAGEPLASAGQWDPAQGNAHSFRRRSSTRRYKPWSPSSTIIVGRMGSSRSARSCLADRPLGLPRPCGQPAIPRAKLKIEVRPVSDENFRVYGVLQGAIRGKTIKTTIGDKAAPCPHVNRQFKAPRPNVLWLSDFTYVATLSGFVYVAFVIDAYARMIVGWWISRTAHVGFVLDALEQAPRCSCTIATGAANTSRSIQRALKQA
jgi:hypothetical protein